MVDVMTSIIDSFRNDYEFLSNFSTSPIVAHGWLCATVEHAYQAAKTLDQSWVRHIVTAHSPGEAKRLGNLAPLRNNWKGIRISMMATYLTLKFPESSKLARKLVDTYPATLIEGNTWHDNFWGDCRCGRPACREIIGENHLGTLLEIRRAILMGDR